MEALRAQFFDLEIIVQAWPLLLQGLWITLTLSVVVVTLGLSLGLLVALASLSERRWLRWPTLALVDLFRALPPLVLLIFVYAGLPFAGLQLSPFLAVVLAFALNNAAYYGEVYRAGLLAVPPGQSESARASGMSALQTLLWVVLPQAVRKVTPDLLSNTVEVIKLTSLASVVSLADLLYRAEMARSLTYNSSPIVAAGVIYLLMLWPLVRLISLFERGDSQVPRH
ncbi:amino acid ABC transporter permease [Halotalea alkalilenta]|uniref:amino acid ABC transporter permease n=1 Tax=Halotalea alkalilenta TaxID=376489 RepID=UPI000487459A|nr:amino acid ABC transporter permease [Halotalea alkalilenta]